MKKYCLSIFVLFFVVHLSAQPLNRMTPPVMLKAAEQAMAEYNYYKALEWYEKAYEDTEDISLVMKMAELNYALRDYKRAEKYYKKFFRKDNIIANADRRFEYARVLKMNGKYTEAIEQFDLLLKESDDPHQIALAEAEKKGAEYAKVATPDTKLTVTNAGSQVNSKSSEYSPYLLSQGTQMYFASFGDNEIIELDRGETTNYGAKILVSQKGENGWQKPTPLSNEINRPGYFTSNLSITPDGSQMFFARQLLTEGNKLKESKIYTSTIDAGDWGPAMEVTTVNGNFIAKSPAVGELFGKEVLFFVSDKGEGYGGYDIYYATSEGGNIYGQPVNLGPGINTVGNEDTPFYQDGALYFSSTGHPGLGGYDIFKCEWNGSEWSTPQNMGPGYNSSVDDLSFMLDETGANGLLTSNRIDAKARSLKSKTCCNDIYTLSIEQIVVDLIAEAGDAKTSKKIDAKIDLFLLENGQPELVKSMNSAPNSPFTTGLALGKAYQIVATAEGYQSTTAELNTLDLTESVTLEKMLALAPLPPPPPKEEYITITKETPFTLENIYYDYNSAAIRLDAEQDLRLLQEIMQENPTMVIELSSHTDSRGKAAYNLNLSQQRAESARQWLVNQGIAPERIVAKGYGETTPKTVNAKIESKHAFLKYGESLDDAYISSLIDEDLMEIAHQVNRRTEVKIIAGPTSIKVEERRLKKIGE